jgi:signal transduction histidine kinase
VAAAVVPIVAFSIAIGVWDVVTTRRAVESGLQDTARALALALDREIASWIGALNALATSGALDAGDLQQFSRQAMEVAALYDGWITMTEPNGQQVVNTRTAPGEPLPRSRGHYFERVFATGQPVVSDLFVSALTGEPLIAVYVPVRRDGAVRYSLNLGLTPERLSELLARQALAPGWLGMVTDGDAQIIARAQGHRRYVGRMAPEWYARGVRNSPSGLLAGPSYEGPAINLAYQRVPGSGWSVAVAVPQATLAAAWRQPLIVMAGAGVLLVALAIAMSLFYAQRIRTSVTGLLSGDRNDPHPISEIEEVRLLLREQADEQARRREAEAAAATAEAANRSKDRFLTTLSHELRTPLSAIIGWIAVIRARGHEPGKMQQALDIIERNAAQQAKLIDDLLDVSRIISGKLQVRREPADLSAAVNEALDAARPAAQEKGLVLQATVQPGIRVDGDYLRLIQITNNLVSNALKFTPKKGRVDVILERHNGSAELTVRDTGRGIDPELHPLLFERFAQADAQRGYQPGLGLGLAIVRHLVGLHGGEVSAQSDGPGRGATFKMRLPTLSAQAPLLRKVPQRAPAATDLSGIRVLVVDDHEDSRQWIATLLAAQGATTAQAGYAGEALAVQQEFRAGVIVSDIAMPGGDGYELIRGLRAREPSRRTAAIALTALAGGEDRERALREGFDAVIAKGADSATVVSEVARLCAVKTP